MILGLFKISGHSMQPTFKNGQKVLASYLPYLFQKPKINDIVVFKYSGKVFIKRIQKTENLKVYLHGDNMNDSLEIKPINTQDILGKVIM